jgi:uncharacterized membrane protein
MGAIKTLQGDTWLGHPAHPAFVALPIGMWVFSLVLDGIAAATKQECAQKAADYAVTGGLVGAGLSAVTGVSEYFRIPKANPAKGTALLHGSLNATATTAYTINAVIRSRRKKEGRSAGVLPKLISVAGVALIGYTGWLGGKLAYDYGVGVSVDRVSGKPVRREVETPSPTPVQPI